jgi:hypothetical protein
LNQKGKSEESSDLESDEPQSPKVGVLSRQASPSTLHPTTSTLSAQISDDLSVFNVSHSGGNGLVYQFEASEETRKTLADLRIKTQQRKDMPISRSKSGLF